MFTFTRSPALYLVLWATLSACPRAAPTPKAEVMVSTVASQFGLMKGVAIDAQGNIYVAETNTARIRKISSNGVITTLAGSDTGDKGYRDGPGTTAQFNGPEGLVVDAQGNVYVADTGNHCIRKVTPDGLVSTFAGLGRASGFQDGPADIARFHTPHGIAIDVQNTLYVADTYNILIRKISPAGVVSTLAGTGLNGFEDGPVATARFYIPRGVAVDGQGKVYVADGHRIRVISPAGIVSTLAGSPGPGVEDGVGQAARFRLPDDVTVTPQGMVYVCDTEGHRIRQITPDGKVSGLAGTGVPGFADGKAAEAQFQNPLAIAVDREGNVYVGDTDNRRIRKITPR